MVKHIILGASATKPGIRGVAPTKVVGVSEHRAGVVASGVL